MFLAPRDLHRVELLALGLRAQHGFQARRIRSGRSDHGGTGSRGLYMPADRRQATRTPHRPETRDEAFEIAFLLRREVAAH